MLAGALDALWRQVVLGLGVVLVLGAALYAVQWATHRALSRAIGFRGIVWWTGWLGTPVHEWSHWIVGKVFGLDIVEVRPFAPDPDTGVLGYVRYRRPPLRPTTVHQVIGTLAMGIAPLFGGALVLWGAWVLLVGPGDAYAAEVRALTGAISGSGLAEVASSFARLVGAVYAAVFDGGAGRWQSWVFLYVALAVGAHLAPSTADLRGGALGLVVLLVLGFAANATALALGASPAGAVAPLAHASAAVAGLLALALVLNLGNLGLAWAMALVRRR